MNYLRRPDLIVDVVIYVGRGLGVGTHNGSVSDAQSNISKIKQRMVIAC